MRSKADSLSSLLFLIIFVVGCEVEGPAGLNALVNLVEEQPGPNCSDGGTKIETGTDSNRDDALGANEVTQVQYVCNGDDGSLTVLESEAPGINCTYGGLKLSTGIDSNSNDALDPNETKTSKYICAVGTDKQIRLPFPTGGSTRSTTYLVSEHISEQNQYLVKFNKTNFADVTSITFGVTLTAAIDPMFSGENATAYVELFNVTDNASIPNSELQITANGTTTTAFLETGDLSSALPEKEIQIVMRIKVSSANHVAQIASAYIFINKN